jgi:hypothetical protein
MRNGTRGMREEDNTKERQKTIEEDGVKGYSRAEIDYKSKQQNKN